MAKSMVICGESPKILTDGLTIKKAALDLTLNGFYIKNGGFASTRNTTDGKQYCSSSHTGRKQASGRIMDYLFRPEASVVNSFMDIFKDGSPFKTSLDERNRRPPYEAIVQFTVAQDLSTKGPYVEPCNCTKIGDVSLPNQAGALEAAKDYCLQDPEHNCCTINGCVVTKWSLPSPLNMVELRKAAEGVYFLCHIDLHVEW